MKVMKKLIIILFLLFMETAKGNGEPVSRYRFYDTHRKMSAEKELDWRLRKNKVENLRLQYEATHKKFDSGKENYIRYLNRTEKDYKSLLRKEEKILSAPYLSFEDRRDISKSYWSQTREVTNYYDKLRRNYYDCVKKSAVIRIVSFPVQIGITVATAGQALPAFLSLQTAKFAYDEYAFSKNPLEGTITQRIINKMYGMGMCFYSAFGAYEHAHVLRTGKDLGGEVVCNTTFPTLARLEYFRAGYAAATPIIQTVTEYSPNSLLARASPYLSMTNSAISIGMEMSKPYQFTREFGNSPKDGAKYFNNFTPSIYSLTTNTFNLAQDIGKVAGGERWAYSNTAYWINQGAGLGSAIADARVSHYKRNNVEYMKQRADIYKDNFEYRAEVMKDDQFTDVCKSARKSLENAEMKSQALSRTERIIERENLWGTGYYKGLTRAEILRREGAEIERVDFSPEVVYVNPILPNLYSSTVGIEGEKNASVKMHLLKGKGTLPVATFNFDGEEGNYIVPDKIDYLAEKYQDVHLDNKGKFSIKVNFPEELRGTESKPQIYYGNYRGDSFIMDMQDRRYNRDWMKTKGLGISYASLGQDRFLLAGSDGAMTAINTRLNPDNKYDYFIQIAKSPTTTEGSDFRVMTDGKVYENPLVKELNQPREQFFESFGNPYLWRESDNSLSKQYGTSYGSKEKELLSQITFQATPQNLARRYDPYMQHYTLRNQGVEQIQDASGKSVTYNRTDEAVEMMPVLGRNRSIEAKEFWRVELGQGTIGNLRTGEVREYSLSGWGAESTLMKNPTPVEVYTGEWQKNMKNDFTGNRFKAREGFRRSIVNMNRHLSAGMGNLVKGLENRNESWINQSQDNFVRLGDDKNEAITQAKIEKKVLGISETVIGTREQPKIDLSFYKDSEGKVIGYSYLPHEKELQDTRDLIDKKVEFLPRQSEIDGLKESSKEYGRIIDKSSKDLLSFVCGLSQTKAMENVLEGSQRVHSRLVNLSGEEPKIVLSNEYSNRRKELINETVKFIATENKLSLLPLVSMFTGPSSKTGYSLEIVVSKDKYELVNYPMKVGYQWEMAKSFDSDPGAPGKLILKIDPISKKVTQSWGGSVEGLKWKLSLGEIPPSLRFSSSEGNFISVQLDTSIGYGQSKKIEFLEGTFLGINHLNTFRASEKFVCHAVLVYLLAHGIVAAPYTVPAPVPVGLNLIPSYQFIHSSGNLPEELHQGGGNGIR